MLKYSFRPSRMPEGTLSFEEDTKLRNAFGRFAKEEFRSAAEEVVLHHQDLQHWFLCDCSPEAQRPPTLFPVAGSHIKRETFDDPKVTPHEESCDFAREPDEQIALVRTYRSAVAENKFDLNLVRNFGDNYEIAPHQTQRVNTNRSRPTLARVLCALLKDAGLDRFNPEEQLRGNRDQQATRLKHVAKGYSLAANRPLDRWLATSLAEYYDLKRRLDARPSGWQRPHGIFIGTFDKIGDNTLVPTRQDLDPISIAGKLAVYGEDDRILRPPYLVIGLISHQTRKSDHVELLNAYAHPCVAWNRLTLVDSQLERETLSLLMKCRYRLAKSYGISMTIEKPIHDVGPAENDTPREICRPDFILRVSGPNVRHETIVIETMGYNDPVYRQRKQRMHSLFEKIQGTSGPVPIIEHDRFVSGHSKESIDDRFCQAVFATIVQLNRDTHPQLRLT